MFGPWEELEGTLGRAKELGELLSGFAPGGFWDGHEPGPELAGAVARAAGPEFRCAVATGEERVGVLRAMARVQSWASAGVLGAVRSLIRDGDEPCLGRPRHGDLPDGWDDSLVHEIALALAVSVPSAGKTARAAWELGARLPGVGLLLRDGTLDLPRARLVTEVFAELSDEDCARAEELLLPGLTSPPRKTYAQIERIATAIAAAVDPGLAGRRRKSAEKHRSRVAMFREQSGTAALTGRDLPVDLALAAYANLDARARLYRESGAFPGERLDRLRAAAFLDILNGVSAADRIACGRLGADDPETDPDADADVLEDLFDEDGPGPDGPGPDGPGAGGADGPDTGPGGPGPRPDPAEAPGLGGSDCPCRECDGRCAPPDDSDPGDDNPDDFPHESYPGGGDPGGGDPEDPHSGGPGRGDIRKRGGNADRDDPAGERPGPVLPPPRPTFPEPAGGPPTLTDLVLPLATLLGHAERPGEGHGLGTLDPALCRALAATATASPRTTLCLTVTDPDGIAIGHGCAKTGRPPHFAGPPDGPAPPLAALPARINLTITASRLVQPRAGTGWGLARRGTGPPGDPDWCGRWALTLPSGLEFRVDLEPVPTFDCDHRNESHAYKPNATLRHLVQIRDYTCTFPPCNRHARDSDFEHALPYDQGGRTCACNAGARSRRCHRVKQSPGWTVTQPKPGWHQWTTPRGRTYTQGPKRYPV